MCRRLRRVACRSRRDAHVSQEIDHQQATPRRLQRDVLAGRGPSDGVRRQSQCDDARPRRGRPTQLEVVRGGDGREGYRRAARSRIARPSARRPPGALERRRRLPTCLRCAATATRRPALPVTTSATGPGDRSGRGGVVVRGRSRAPCSRRVRDVAAAEPASAATCVADRAAAAAAGRTTRSSMATRSVSTSDRWPRPRLGAPRARCSTARADRGDEVGSCEQPAMATKQPVERSGRLVPLLGPVRSMEPRLPPTASSDCE